MKLDMPAEDREKVFTFAFTWLVFAGIMALTFTVFSFGGYILVSFLRWVLN